MDVVQRAATFLFVFAIVTICFAICWGMFVANHLYNCTDSLPGAFDYFTPGDWVHSWKPIQFVPEVHSGRSMSEPDVIRSGWTISALWCVWLTTMGASVAISILAVRSSPKLARPY